MNPLQTLSAAFFMISPFLGWSVALFFVIAQIRGVRLLLDEYSTQSTLWQISQGATGTAISQNVEAQAFYSALLLFGGGLVSLRYFKTGLFVSFLALTTFLLESYTGFGKISGGATIGYVSPGIGAILAATGIVIGTVSLRFKKRSIFELLSLLKSKEGLTRFGAVMALIPLALDGLNHASVGQFGDFIGTSPLEMALHLGFICGIPILVVLETFRFRGRRTRLITFIALMALLFMIGDGTYHLVHGEIYEFIGHDAIEQVLHTVTYYGIAIAVLARFILKR